MSRVLRTTTGRVVRRPTANQVELVVASLPRGEAVIVEDTDPTADQTYAQAWLNPGGLFQLEIHLDQTRHLRRITAQAAVAVGVLTGWLQGRLPDDLDTWDNLAHMLDAARPTSAEGPPRRATRGNTTTSSDEDENSHG